MAEWAYACRQPGKSSSDTLYVSAMSVTELPEHVNIVRVKVGADWQCAVLDRSRRLEVASQLIRQVIPSSPQDCPDCAALLEPPAEEPESADDAAIRGDALPADAPTIRAALIDDPQGALAIVLAPLELVQSSGEAAMVVEDLQPYFPQRHIVLVGQDEHGAAVYHNASTALALRLNQQPLNQWPWRDHPLS